MPEDGWYRELLNSDSETYGGGNVGNAGGVEADSSPMHGFDYSMSLMLPPLGFVMLKKQRHAG